MHSVTWLLAILALDTSLTLANPIAAAVNHENKNLMKRATTTTTTAKTTSTTAKSTTKTTSSSTSKTTAKTTSTTAKSTTTSSTSTTKKTSSAPSTTTGTATKKTTTTTTGASVGGSGSTSKTTTPTKTTATVPPAPSSTECGSGCYFGSLSMYCDSAVYDPGASVGSARWTTATDCQHDAFERWHGFQYMFVPNVAAGADNCFFYDRNGDKLLRYARDLGVTSGGLDCGSFSDNYGGYP